MKTNHFIHAYLLAFMSVCTLSFTAPLTAETRTTKVNSPIKSAKEKAPAKRNITANLKRTIRHVELTEIPLRQALEQWAKAVDVDLLVNWTKLETEGVNTQTPVSMKLKHIPATKVLKLILNTSDTTLYAHLTPWYVEILTETQMKKTSVTRIYDVSALIADMIDFEDAPTFELSVTNINGGGGIIDVPAIDGGDGKTTDRQTRLEELADLIREQVEPDAWKANGGDKASIRIYQNYFFIKAPQYMHNSLGMLHRVK